MSSTTSKCGNYRIEYLSAATFPGAITVILEAFCKDEPVCIGSEVNKNPLAAEELAELCADAALDSVSVVAVSVNSGEVVGVSFNKLQTPPENPNAVTFFDKFTAERCTQESAKSLIRFMSNVDSRCDLFQKHKANCSLEVMFLAVLKQYRRQNLATLLVQASVDLARTLKNGPVAKITHGDLGSDYAAKIPKRDVTKTYPKICQALFTGPNSQKVGQKVGFHVDFVVQYDEFIYDGKSY